MRDDAWFEGVFTAHAGAVYRYFRRRAAADDVEDLTADVMVTAWRRRDDVPEGAELPWLYRTAGFVLANHRRKGRPIPVEQVPDEVDDADPATLVLDDQEVRAVLSMLSVRDRRILLLHAWDGLDGEQLAEVLGISRGGADAALSRARARLRQAWAAHEAGDTMDEAADAAEADGGAVSDHAVPDGVAADEPPVDPATGASSEAGATQTR